MEVLESVTGIPIDILGNLDNARRTSFQYPFGKEEHNFVKVEIERLLRKGVIVFSQHEVGELISPIFVRPKDDGLYRLILNLKHLNEVTHTLRWIHWHPF